MRRLIFSLILIALTVTACQSAPNISSITPPYVDTGVDPDSWASVPAGEFPRGQEAI